MSRLPRRFWLGSSTSPPLMTRSNLSFGPIAAKAGALAAASASRACGARKSRRDKTDMSPSPMVPVLARLTTKLTTGKRMAGFHTRLIALALCAVACRWDGPRVGRISRAADPPDRAVPGRRHGRSGGAARHRAHGGRPEDIVRDREPRRRGRRDRDRCDRQGRARRLHAAAHRAEPHHQRGAAGKAALRHREGPGAGRDGGRGAGAAGQPSGRAVCGFQGLHRLRQGQSRQAELFLGRQRHAAACHHGIAAAAASASRSRTSPIAAPRRR